MSLKTLTDPIEQVCDLYAERFDIDQAIQRKWLSWLDKAA
jgi:hypothetical protein